MRSFASALGATGLLLASCAGASPGGRGIARGSDETGLATRFGDVAAGHPTVSAAQLPPAVQRLPARESRVAVRDGPAVVQVAALPSEPRARALAATLGGSVEPVGREWRVRLGPYATRAQAERARDAAAARGYGDAAVLDAF